MHIPLFGEKKKREKFIYVYILCVAHSCFAQFFLHKENNCTTFEWHSPHFSSHPGSTRLDSTRLVSSLHFFSNIIRIICIYVSIFSASFFIFIFLFLFSFRTNIFSLPYLFFIRIQYYVCTMYVQCAHCCCHGEGET